MDIKKYIKNNTLKINVKPNSKKNQILKYENNALKIAIKAPPENNKANKEIIKFFSKLNLKIKIIKGLKSKEKILKIL